ncbi:hypothetical protein H3V17_02650 [Bartonella sp. M0283]|uniref:hypothetical protein n=1 Tax=Bartonella sp. M0283 TaxID=2751016 RepID=UPI0018DE72DF|nr:hypothetical protein [Bartonella sp. M0283]MBI0162545.1 hypothetical protein [Bartonella sp. M0283]
MGGILLPLQSEIGFSAIYCRLMPLEKWKAGYKVQERKMCILGVTVTFSWLLRLLVNGTGLNLLKEFGYFAHAVIPFRFNTFLLLVKRRVFFLPRNWSIGNSFNRSYCENG